MIRTAIGFELGDLSYQEILLSNWNQDVVQENNFDKIILSGDQDTGSDCIVVQKKSGLENPSPLPISQISC